MTEQKDSYGAEMFDSLLARIRKLERVVVDLYNCGEFIQYWEDETREVLEELKAQDRIVG